MNHRIDNLSRGMLCFLLMSLLLVGCKTKTSDRDIMYLEHDDLINMLENPRHATLIVDVRSREDFDASHIPGAVSLPLANIRAGQRLLSKATHLVVYAKDFSSPLSSAAAKKLVILGYQNVYDFRGGLRVWQDEAGAVVSSPN